MVMHAAASHSDPSGASTPTLLTSPLLACVPHAFSTRIGGVSTSPFDSLNFGNPMDLPQHEKDPVSNIEANFARVAQKISAQHREIVQVYQIHGARTQIFRPGDPSRDASSVLSGGEVIDFKADALVTDDPRRLVAVRVADCAPILLASDDGRVVAAVHAGWRGAVAGIAHSAISAMQSLGARRIIGVIGPCIGPAAFEVSSDVASEFDRAFGSGFVVPRVADTGVPIAGKFIANLPGALRMQLLRAGVEAVDVLDACTLTEPARFFSHRRDRGRTGRMIGIIGPASA